MGVAIRGKGCVDLASCVQSVRPGTKGRRDPAVEGDLGISRHCRHCLEVGIVQRTRMQGAEHRVRRDVPRIGSDRLAGVALRIQNRPRYMLIWARLVGVMALSGSRASARFSAASAASNCSAYRREDRVRVQALQALGAPG